ncbi:MAG: hypothetical protein U0169_15480 [Polyangiaceae bacterium]
MLVTPARTPIASSRSAPGRERIGETLVTLGRSIADGIAYSAYATDPGSGSVAALVLRPPQTTSDLWTGPHPWDATERVVGVGGGQIYLSLPAQVTYDGETRPGRALARMPVTGGTPVTVVDSDFQGTGRNRTSSVVVVTSDGTAYFAIDRGIVGMATVTGNPRPLALSDDQDSFGVPESLRVADGYLYFMDRTSEAFTTKSSSGA